MLIVYPETLLNLLAPVVLGLCVCSDLLQRCFSHKPLLLVFGLRHFKAFQDLIGKVLAATVTPFCPGI